MIVRSQPTHVSRWSCSSSSVSILNSKWATSIATGCGARNVVAKLSPPYLRAKLSHYTGRRALLRDSRLVCRAFVALANPPTTRGELRRGYLFCGENPQTALLAAQARHFPARTGKTGPARRGSRIYESGLENRARFLGIFGSESHTDHPVKKRTGIPTQLPGSTLGVARLGRRRRQLCPICGHSQRPMRGLSRVDCRPSPGSWRNG